MARFGVDIALPDLLVALPNGLSHHERPSSDRRSRSHAATGAVRLRHEAGRSPDAERQVRSLARRVKRHRAASGSCPHAAGLLRIVFEALGARRVAEIPDNAVD